MSLGRSGLENREDPARSEPAAWVFIAAVVLASVAFATVVARPLNSLLTVVPDDAFYYLGTARNIARHGLSSFDGVNLTNGYHPGWMALLVLCAKVFADPEWLLRAALVAGFVLHLAGAFMLSKGLARWVSPSAARIGGALWAVNPMAMTFAVEAMEAPLYILALTGAFWFYSTRLAASRVAGSPPPRAASFAGFGLSLSLCFHGRTEAIVLSGIVMLALAWRYRRGPWPTALFVTGFAFALGIAPWFLYSRWATNSWFQHSGSMKLLWAAEGSAKSHTRVLDSLDYLFGNWTSYPIIGVPGGQWSGPRGIVAGIVTVGLVGLLLKALKKPSMRAHAAMGLLLTSITLLTGLVYATLFSEQQYWYKAQPGVILFEVLFVTLCLWLDESMPRFRTAAAAGACAVMTLGLAGRFVTLNSYPWQADVLASQRDFDEIVPQGEVIGAFNAGIPGYFGKHVVVNLDGLMNNTIYEFYRQRAFDRYLTDADIHYVADEIEAVGRGLTFTRRKVSLEVVTTRPLTKWASGKRYLWKVSVPTF